MTLATAVDIIYDSGLYTLEEIRRMTMDKIICLAWTIGGHPLSPITQERWICRMNYIPGMANTVFPRLLAYTKAFIPCDLWTRTLPPLTESTISSLPGNSEESLILLGGTTTAPFTVALEHREDPKAGL